MVGERWSSIAFWTLSTVALRWKRQAIELWRPIVILRMYESEHTAQGRLSSREGSNTGFVVGWAAVGNCLATQVVAVAVLLSGCDGANRSALDKARGGWSSLTVYSRKYWPEMYSCRLSGVCVGGSLGASWIIILEGRRREDLAWSSIEGLGFGGFVWWISLREI
ncbi:hypothetical protein F4810DRAFT_245335 [Camillea tinctor]|nr:hypothetical protein F4810DRAFT_245335 [Camillea tinctor]